MNFFGAALHPLWILALVAALSAPLFLLYLQLSQTRIGRRLRRRLLQRDWKPVFVQPYRLPDAAGDAAGQEPPA